MNSNDGIDLYFEVLIVLFKYLKANGGLNKKIRLMSFGKFKLFPISA
jgi:hypothetical protein